MHMNINDSNDDSTLTPSSILDAGDILERLRAASASIKVAAGFAWDLDWLGDADSHPEDSEQRDLAEWRDEVDATLATLLSEVLGHCRWRAETTQTYELLSLMVAVKRGEAGDMLHLMERHEELFGEDDAADRVTGVAGLPNALAWDTYLRVEALADIAEERPETLQASARLMEGWPMIVRHDHDCGLEFKRLTTRLQVGPTHS